MAISEDAEGRSGTWYKWFRGDFTEPGLGGRATPIPALAGHAGGNPSVHWNTFLERWVMVWHRWKGDLWISTSHDLTEWTRPKLLLEKPSGKGKIWYPTLIGESDSIDSATTTLLYAEFPDGLSTIRRFNVRETIFLKIEPNSVRRTYQSPDVLPRMRQQSASPAQSRR